MHFEILVEDQSGKRMLQVLVPYLIREDDTYNIHAYRGIGRLPEGLKPNTDASKRILLDQLPRLLSGYGTAFANFPDGYDAAVVVVCDLDRRCFHEFRLELLEVVATCPSAPRTQFCIAVEEGEAWLLGDLQAVRAAYPKAKEAVLNAYVNDAICGTWEVLANAVYPGGESALSTRSFFEVGGEKIAWAENITPLMTPEDNLSPSFRYFVGKLRSLSVP